MKNDPGSVMMIPSQTTTASLQNLVPNAEYYVSVAGINSCGGTSAFERAEFTLRGNSLHGYAYGISGLAYIFQQLQAYVSAFSLIKFVLCSYFHANMKKVCVAANHIAIYYIID